MITYHFKTMNRLNYQYQIIRYMPDRVKEEFVNVGVVIYSKEARYLQVEVVDKYRRITQFFGDINGQYLLNTLKYIKSEVESLNSLYSHEEFELPASLEIISGSILPNDDSALYMTGLYFGLDINLEKAFQNLAKKYLFYEGEKRESLTDKEVWHKIYKVYFDKHGVSKSLKEKTIKTQTIDINFDLAFKNGVWNCLEAVNFDLKFDDSITDKLFRYLGKFDTLGTSDEELKYHILANLKPGNGIINEHIRQNLDNRVIGSATINLVTEENADAFVKKIKEVLH